MWENLLSHYQEKRLVYEVNDFLKGLHKQEKGSFGDQNDPVPERFRDRFSPNDPRLQMGYRTRHDFVSGDSYVYDSDTDSNHSYRSNQSEQRRGYNYSGRGDNTGRGREFVSRGRDYVGGAPQGRDFMREAQQGRGYMRGEWQGRGYARGAPQGGASGLASDNRAGDLHRRGYSGGN